MKSNHGFQLCSRDLNVLPTADAVVELKYDGEMALWDGKNLWNRRGNEISDKFPELNLPPNVVLIGEIVIFNQDGVSEFTEILRRGENRVVNRLRAKVVPATFVAFDIIEKDGKDLKTMPQSWRKALLISVPGIKTPKSWSIEHLEEAKEYVRIHNEEGLIIKRLESPYVICEGEKRSNHWIKWKAWMYRAFPVIRAGPTGTGDGFTAFINNLGREQEVAVQHPSAREKLRDGGGRFIVVRFLEENENHALRQPTCKGVYADSETATKVAMFAS